MFDRQLLRELQQKIEKKAFVPPPPPSEGMGQPGMGDMGQPGMGDMGQPGMGDMGQPGQSSMGQPTMEELVPLIMQAAQEGVAPEEVVGRLQQEGVPDGMIDEAMQIASQEMDSMEQQQQQQQAPPPVDVRELISKNVDNEIKKRNTDDPTRLTVLEAKVDTLVDLVESFIQGLPPKEAGLKTYSEGVLDALRYQNDIDFNG